MALVVKNSTANAGDMGLIPESGRSPGEGNGNPFPYFWLENPMGREAWQVAKSWIRLRTRTHTHFLHIMREQERASPPTVLCVPATILSIYHHDPIYSSNQNCDMCYYPQFT